MGNHMPNQKDLSQLSFNYLQRGEDWVQGANMLEQSPIDIITKDAQNQNDKMRMEFYLTDHNLTGLKVDDTGNTLQVNGPFSKLLATDVDGSVYEYEAVQFHFHAPSEHTLNGEYYDLELHIVHQITERCAKKGNVKRNLAVVGLFFDLDENPNAKPNPFIEALKLNKVGSDINLNMFNLLEKDIPTCSNYYAYKGSLTVPPCSDNANWYVVEKPLLINEEQLEQFDLRWKDNPDYAGGFGNNRPVQPLNGRVVMKSNHCLVCSRSDESVRNFLDEDMQRSPPLKERLEIDPDMVERRASIGKKEDEAAADGKEDEKKHEVVQSQDDISEKDDEVPDLTPEQAIALKKRRLTANKGTLLKKMLSQEDVQE